MTPEVRRLVYAMARFAVGEVVDMTALGRRAAAIREREEAHKARRRTNVNPRVTSVREAKAERLERHRRFVEAVFARDGYCCQLCPFPDHVETLDPHHLEMGPNKIKHEKLSNTLTAHRSCHDAAHRNEAAFVPAVKAWAAKHGYPLPNRKVYR